MGAEVGTRGLHLAGMYIVQVELLKLRVRIQRMYLCIGLWRHGFVRGLGS
jgi:hypothetical protein